MRRPAAESLRQLQGRGTAVDEGMGVTRKGGGFLLLGMGDKVPFSSPARDGMVLPATDHLLTLVRPLVSHGELASLLPPQWVGERQHLVSSRVLAL